MNHNGMDGKEAAKSLEDKKLAEIVGRLIDAYRPERIYLFGSRKERDVGSKTTY